MTREDLWNENIEFYKELVTKYHFQQEQMIALFPILKEAGFFEKYYPSNSLESLGISTERIYERRCIYPMVYLTYTPQDDSFIVHYQQGQGNTIAKENVGPKVLHEVLAKIETWLSIGEVL